MFQYMTDIMDTMNVKKYMLLHKKRELINQPRWMKILLALSRAKDYIKIL